MPNTPRLRFPVLAVLLAGLALGAAACHKRPPVAPSAEHAMAAPAAPPTPTPAPSPTAPRVDHPPSAPASATTTTSTAEPTEEASAEEEESESGPQAAQKEALDLCQAASDLLDTGKTDEAVAALDRAYGLMLTLPGNGDDAYLQAKEDIRRLVSDLIQRAYKTQRAAAQAPAPAPSWDLAVPIVDNAHVQREIQSFTNGERERFLEAYRRSGLYRPMILTKLEAAGLPSQLAWLPLVESEFKVRALSRAGALGLWQFIASTGLRYGLSRDGWVDERLDPERSTDGAIAFLTELHALFGDWPKVLAAYNCGPARLHRNQVRSSEYLDFWDLYEQLPSETRRYVPRFIAALLIIENPAKYGMQLPEPLTPTDGLTPVSIARAVELEKLDASLGFAAGTLRELNPELRSGATPPRPYELRVPADKSEAVAAAAAQLPQWKRPVPLYSVHRVRPGDTLGLIAQRYGTTITAIQRVNGLRSARMLRVGQRLRIPTRGSAAH